MKNDQRKMRHRNIGIAFTRKEYINKIPQGKEKEMKWTYGNINKTYKHELKLICTNLHYISVNSLDAVRVAVGHALGTKQEAKVGEVKPKEEENKELPFFMRIHPYPHQFLREHGLLGVQKAERLAKGMKKSFGKTQSRVALVHPNQILITLRINDDLMNHAKHALDVASKKLGCASRIEIGS